MVYIMHHLDRVLPDEALLYMRQFLTSKQVEAPPYHQDTNRLCAYLVKLDLLRLVWKPKAGWRGFFNRTPIPQYEPTYLGKQLVVVLDVFFNHS